MSLTKTIEYQVEIQGKTLNVYDWWGSTTVEMVALEFLDNPFPKLESPKVILDLGANIGLWAIWMALEYPGAALIALEPQKDNAKHLALGARRNKALNIEVCECAVSSDGKDMVMTQDLSNSGSASFRGEHPHIKLPVRKEVVPSLALNSMFKSLDMPVDYVKVDIEGYEYHLFDGFTHWDKIKGMFLEIHHPWHLTSDPGESKKIAENFVNFIQRNMQGKPLKIRSSDRVIEEELNLRRENG